MTSLWKPHCTTKPPGVGYAGRRFTSSSHLSSSAANCWRSRCDRAVRPTGLHAAGTKRIHKITHGELLPDRCRRIAFSARVQRRRPFRQYIGSQRDIRGDHQISCVTQAYYLVIRHVKPGRNAQRTDVSGGRHADILDSPPASAAPARARRAK